VEFAVEEWLWEDLEADPVDLSELFYGIEQSELCKHHKDQLRNESAEQEGREFVSKLPELCRLGRTPQLSQARKQYDEVQNKSGEQ